MVGRGSSRSGSNVRQQFCVMRAAPRLIGCSRSRARLGLGKTVATVESDRPGLRSLGGREVVSDQLQRSVGVDATRTEVIIATDRSEIVGAVSD
jgi:hypothetical protein